MNRDVAVLVTSHDDYADIWPIAGELFKRFWPDRQWPLYWMSNGAPVPLVAFAGVPLARVDRTQWGRNVAHAVELTAKPLILLWVEEILLLSPVPNDVLLEAVEIMKTHPDIGIVGLTRYYVKRDEQATIGSFAHCREYGPAFTSAMPAIFRKDVLLHLLHTLPGPNDFEQQSFRVMERDMPQVQSLIPARPMFRFCDNALVAGKWTRCAIEHIKEMGFEVDFEKRGIFPDERRFMDGTPA